MSFNPSLLGQGFLEGSEREREALPGYKIKTANLLIIFSRNAAVDVKIVRCGEADLTRLFLKPNRSLSSKNRQRAPGKYSWLIQRLCRKIF